MSELENNNNTNHAKLAVNDKLAPLAVGDQKLNRHLGFFSGTMMNIGQIIGTGIFSTPAIILQNTGSGGMMLILWVIGAFAAASGLSVFLELGTMNAIQFNNFFTLLKIVLLLLLICVGFAGLSGRLPNQPDFKENFSFQGTFNSPGSYANSLYYVIFSYGGYHNLQRVTDELKDPIKNLPRCGIASVAFTTVLYLLANVAYLAVLPLEVIANSDVTVAANLFSTAFGGIFGTKVLPVFVGLSSFGYVGIVTYPGSRVILEFARQGHLPFDKLFSKLHPKYHTPVSSILLLYITSLIFLLAPPPGTAFQFIMSFSGYSEYFFTILCCAAVLILRRREPKLKRYFRAPFPLVLFYFAVCAFALIFYIKMVIYDGLGQSYNNAIRNEGQLELYKDVFQNHQSSGPTVITSAISCTPDASINDTDNDNNDKRNKQAIIEIKEIELT
ncbi:amino acid permease-domain-containing protein [Cunninghamella echinulata]|nr:amino acid permease-domain-containing protein [Cunninghamella echinulata]